MTLRIGTRGSALALTQANWVADRIRERFPGAVVEMVVIKTKGDIMQDVALAKIGGKGLFVKEIEDALLRGEVDLAIHSMKDMPVDLPDGLEIGSIPLREDPRDVLISKDNRKIEQMRRSARIGTGSLRRGLQLRSVLPDLEIVPLRGNLDTRIRKIETENLDGVIVAAAGMKRMGWVRRISQFLPVELVLPAIGQGALGIELRQEDERVREAVLFLNHPVTALEVEAERAFLRRLGGGCQLPVAAYARIQRDELALQGLVGSVDGRTLIRDEVRGQVTDGQALGRALAETILARGGEALLQMVYGNC